MKAEVTLEVIYPHAPERVWRALTDRRVLGEWLLPNTFEPRLGHRFQFLPPPRHQRREPILCEVIELQPPFRLAYTWQAPDDHAPSVVTWILEPVPGGTRLRLSHTRAEDAAAPAGEARGDAWAVRLAALRQALWSAGGMAGNPDRHRHLTREQGRQTWPMTGSSGPPRGS